MALASSVRHGEGGQEDAHREDWLHGGEHSLRRRALLCSGSAVTLYLRDAVVSSSAEQTRPGPSGGSQYLMKWST